MDRGRERAQGAQMFAGHPFSAPVQLFTGKGGVGKSTVVASCAMAAARHGKTPLVVELGHRGTMQALFENPVGSKPTVVARVGEREVFALRVDPDEQLHAFVESRTRLGRLVRTKTLGRFFRAAPAVDEVLTLDLIRRLKSEGRFDPILVDLDATGHARMFLSLPEVFDGLAKSGPLRHVLDGLIALLSDRESTALHLVSTPAELPRRETAELHAWLVEREHVGLGALIVNRMPLLSPMLAAELGHPAAERRLSLLRASRPADADLVVRAQTRVESSQRVLDRFSELELPTRVLHAQDTRNLVALGEELWP